MKTIRFIILLLGSIALSITTAWADSCKANVGKQNKANIDYLERQFNKNRYLKKLGIGKRAKLNNRGQMRYKLKPKGKKGNCSKLTRKMKVVKKPARPARKGTNPFTGEEMMFKAKPARKVVKVLPLKGLKDMV